MSYTLSGCEGLVITAFRVVCSFCILHTTYSRERWGWGVGGREGEGGREGGREGRGKDHVIINVSYNDSVCVCVC